MDKLNITLPDGWHEINLRCFQELSNLNELEGLHKIVELISVLGNKDPEDIKKISSDDFEKLLPHIQWTCSLPSKEYKTHINIDGVDYYLVKLSSLSLGEWMDLDTWFEDSIANIHKIFALLYRPEFEEYDSDKMELRSELFLDKLMIEDVYGTLLFFSTIGNQYHVFIKEYTSQTITI
jgi:hypothetical protein